jgi:3-methyladenine DNA glycosylase Mpg
MRHITVITLARERQHEGLCNAMLARCAEIDTSASAVLERRRVRPHARALRRLAQGPGLPAEVAERDVRPPESRW